MEGPTFVFAVVEFVDEASVSVIHKSWIESSDQVHYTFVNNNFYIDIYIFFYVRYVHGH